jgi:hypothetical protein
MEGHGSTLGFPRFSLLRETAARRPALLRLHPHAGAAVVVAPVGHVGGPVPAWRVQNGDGMKMGELGDSYNKH